MLNSCLINRNLQTHESCSRVFLRVHLRALLNGRVKKHKAFENMPTNFWMNSMGGTAGEGRWVTTLMYTEDIQEAESFKDVLLRWQSKHNSPRMMASDLIQIEKK